MIRRAILCLLCVSCTAVASDAVQRCLSARDLGVREGDLLFTLALRSHDACVTVTREPMFFWNEAQTARMFLWDTGAFPPVAGLEAEQPCRIEGQNLGIEAAQQALLAECRLAMEEDR